MPSTVRITVLHVQLQKACYLQLHQRRDKNKLLYMQIGDICNKSSSFHQKHVDDRVMTLTHS